MLVQVSKYMTSFKHGLWSQFTTCFNAPTHYVCKQGAVGLAIWVPSITNQSKETEASDTRNMTRGYSALSPTIDKNAGNWRRVANGNELELSVIGNVENLEGIDEDIILEDLKVCPNFYFISVLIGIDIGGPGSSSVHTTVLLGPNDRPHFVREVRSLCRDVKQIRSIRQL